MRHLIAAPLLIAILPGAALASNWQVRCENPPICSHFGCVTSEELPRASTLCRRWCGSQASVTATSTSNCTPSSENEGSNTFYIKTWLNDHQYVGYYAVESLPRPARANSPACGTGDRDSRCLRICLTAPAGRRIASVQTQMKDRPQAGCNDPAGYFDCSKNADCSQPSHSGIENYAEDGQTICATFKNWSHTRMTCGRLLINLVP